jgi:transposase
MKTLPVEYRHRVLALTEEGSSTAEIAEVLGTSGAWVRSIKALHKAAGRPLEPKSRANKRKSLAEREGERLRARVREKPGSTLEDLKRDLKLAVSISGLWNALRDLKISLKKVPPRRRAGAARRRRRPRELGNRRAQDRPGPPRLPRRNLRHHRHDASLRVGPQERTRGRLRAARAPENHHLRRRLPLGRALRPLVVDGAMNGELFANYIRQEVAPHLESGDILVLDNLPTHKGKGVAEAVEERDARVLYLPAYSPDFNPIEQVFSKIKNELRRRELRTIPALENAFGESLDWFNPAQRQNYFANSGYSP